MRCSTCQTELDREAAYCSRCGAAQGGQAADADSKEHRHEVALVAFREGRPAAGVQCPNCGGYRMQTVRQDAEENLFWSAAFIVAGIVSLLIVVVAGDLDLIVADLSTVSLALLLIGALLWAVARRRRRPSAYECFDCNYRVP